MKLIDKVRSYYKALQYEGSNEQRKDFPNLVVARRESVTGGEGHAGNLGSGKDTG